MEKYSLWLWKKAWKTMNFFLLLCCHPISEHLTATEKNDIDT